MKTFLCWLLGHRWKLASYVLQPTKADLSYACGRCLETEKRRLHGEEAEAMWRHEQMFPKRRARPTPGRRPA